MTSYIVPLFILIIVIAALIEKKNVYQLFISGVKDGVKTVYTIFPYIFAITILSGLLNDSKILNNINIFNLPSEIFPLILIKPLSGGASMGLVVDIFKRYGPDSFIGLFASILMAATETTLYVVSILSSKVKIKDMRLPIICGLIGDFTAVILAILFTNLMIE